MKHRNAGRPMAIRALFIRKGNEHGICVAARLPIPPYPPIRKGQAPVTPHEGGEAYAQSHGGNQRARL